MDSSKDITPSQTFAEKVEAGSSSTISIDKELTSVELETESLDKVAEYYKLSQLTDKKNVSKSTEKNLLLKVIAGDINPEFLRQLSPILGKIDPSILATFASGKGAWLLQLLSTLYTEQRLDLDIMGKLIDDPKVRDMLAKVQLQYRNNGLAAVSTSDLMSLVEGLNLSNFAESGAPLKRLLEKVIEKRTLSVEMISEVLSSRNESESGLEMDHASIPTEISAEPLSDAVNEEDDVLAIDDAA